jgi:Domain of unknown function (DUF4145)
MDWLTFISKLVGDVAWPGAAFGAVLLLREPLKAMLALVSKVKVSSVEVEFDRKLGIAKEEALSEIPQLASAADRLPSMIDPETLKLAEVSPRAAVMEAWRHVEAAALRAAKSLVQDGTFTNQTMTFRAIGIIEKSGALPSTIVDLMRRLRALRNDAAHAAEFDLSVGSAIEYLQLAVQVVSYLEGVAAKPQDKESSKPPP